MSPYYDTTWIWHVAVSAMSKRFGTDIEVLYLKRSFDGNGTVNSMKGSITFFEY